MTLHHGRMHKLPKPSTNCKASQGICARDIALCLWIISLAIKTRPRVRRLSLLDWRSIDTRSPRRCACNWSIKRRMLRRRCSYSLLHRCSKLSKMVHGIKQGGRTSKHNTFSLVKTNIFLLQRKVHHLSRSRCSCPKRHSPMFRHQFPTGFKPLSHATQST